MLGVIGALVNTFPLSLVVSGRGKGDPRRAGDLFFFFSRIAGIGSSRKIFITPWWFLITKTNFFDCEVDFSVVKALRAKMHLEAGC